VAGEAAHAGEVWTNIGTSLAVVLSAAAAWLGRKAHHTANKRQSMFRAEGYSGPSARDLVLEIELDKIDPPNCWRRLMDRVASQQAEEAAKAAMLAHEQRELDTLRKLGSLEGQVESLTRQVAGLEADVKYLSLQFSNAVQVLAPERLAKTLTDAVEGKLADIAMAMAVKREGDGS